METFVVRVFVAEDLAGFEGTLQRPGAELHTFHDAADLIRQLTEIVGQREGELSTEGDLPHAGDE